MEYETLGSLFCHANADRLTGFYINLPVGGLTALLLVFLRIPEQRAKAQASLSREQIAQLDLIGFSIVAPSIVMFLLALNWGGETYAWASAKIIGLLCGAFVALCIFLIWEWRMGEQAMVPLYMFRRRIIVSCLATGFLQSGAIVEMTYFLPIWFQVVRGDSPTTSGVNIMPTVGAQIFFAATTGLLGKPPILASLHNPTLAYNSSRKGWLPTAFRPVWQLVPCHWGGFDEYTTPIHEHW
jgi:hypothetical protein